MNDLEQGERAESAVGPGASDAKTALQDLANQTTTVVQRTVPLRLPTVRHPLVCPVRRSHRHPAAATIP